MCIDYLFACNELMTDNICVNFEIFVLGSRTELYCLYINARLHNLSMLLRNTMLFVWIVDAIEKHKMKRECA